MMKGYKMVELKVILLLQQLPKHITTFLYFQKRNFYLVSYRKLNESEKAQFDEAKAKEINNVIENDVIFALACLGVLALQLELLRSCMILEGP